MLQLIFSVSLFFYQIYLLVRFMKSQRRLMDLERYREILDMQEKEQEELIQDEYAVIYQSMWRFAKFFFISSIHCGAVFITAYVIITEEFLSAPKPNTEPIR